MPRSCSGGLIGKRFFWQCPDTATRLTSIRYSLPIHDFVSSPGYSPRPCVQLNTIYETNSATLETSWRWLQYLSLGLERSIGRRVCYVETILLLFSPLLLHSGFQVRDKET